MGVLEIVLLVVGGALAILSFAIPAVQEELPQETRKLARDEIKILVSQEISGIKQSVEDTVDESVSYATEKTERALERLTNEKIMAVNEYSDTVLGDIHKNHEEAMFLYDMLNDKHTSLKNMLAELNTAVKEAAETRRGIEEAGREVEEIKSGVEGVRAEAGETVSAVGEAKREVEATWQGIEAARQEVEATWQGIEATKQEVEATWQGIEATKQEVEETRRGVEETIRRVEEIRQEIEGTRQEVEGTRQEVEGTKREVEETRRKAETVVNSFQQMKTEAPEPPFRTLTAETIEVSRQKSAPEAAEPAFRQFVPEQAEPVLRQPAPEAAEPAFRQFVPEQAEPVLRQPAPEAAKPVFRRFVPEEVEPASRQSAPAAGKPVKRAFARQENETQPVSAGSYGNTGKQAAGEDTVSAGTPVNLSFMTGGREPGVNRNEQILKLHRQGKSKVAIARELGLGVGEVKLVIDLYKNV